jgi:hypothetical protein
MSTTGGFLVLGAHRNSEFVIQPARCRAAVSINTTVSGPAK